MHLSQHDYTMMGGGVGFFSGIALWYLRHVIAINDVLQTLLFVLSLSAIIIGWVKKGRSRE